MVRIWERLRQQGIQQLPPIIPVVVHHGKAPWQVATNFGSLFAESEALQPYRPEFRYELRDLGQHSREEIRGEAFLRMILLLMRHILDPALPEQLPDIFALLKGLRGLAEEKTALEYLEVALRYLSIAAPDVPPQNVRAALEAAFAGSKDEGAIMTGWVEKWIEQGLEEGRPEVLTMTERLAERWRKQGEQQGQHRTLEENILRVLNRRFNQVPADIADRLQQLSVETLEVAFDEALTAFDLADFVQHLESVED
jgi:hypothetical protein